MATSWNKAVLKEIVKETEQTWRFFFEVPDTKTFDFTPGQFVTFDLPIHFKPGKRMRSYSIASSPNGTNEFELIIVYLEGGVGTTYLFFQAAIGAEIPFRGPLGKFVLPEKIEQDICLICTGTGIAPFRSQLLDLYNNKKGHKNIHLLFGTRYITDLLYNEELLDLEKKMEGFTFLPALSREQSEEWKGHKGYVHPIYEDIFKGRTDVKYYLCGWRVMIDEARKRLNEMGVDRKDIHFELYD